MQKTPNAKTQRAAKGRAPKRVPSPTPQDGALGAGGTSALVVLANYVFRGQIPAEVIAAAAPFISFGVIYFVAAAKHYEKVRRERNDVEEYERDVLRLLEDDSISAENKERLKAHLEEFRLLQLDAKRRTLVARLEETMSAVTASASNI
jgi:hypothetical protein